MAYTKITDFAVKDSLLSGNPAKLIRGTEIDAEFTELQTQDAQNVKGPGSATDNAVARYDTTTGKLLQSSTVLISDTGVISGVAAGAVGTPSISPTGDTNTGVYFPAADTVGVSTGGVERTRIDSAGNLGLAVTPSAWVSSYKALELGSGSLVYPANATNLQLRMNAYTNSGGIETYKATGIASLYSLGGGGNSHAWYTAPSGTAGNPITFTQAMTLDAAGNWILQGSSGSSSLATYTRCAATETTFSSTNTSGSPKPFKWSVNAETNTAMTLDANGNLYTGATSTSTAARVGVKGATADSTTYAFHAENSSAATLISARNDGRVYLNGQTIGQSGNTIGLGTASPQTGAGISFPATQVASSDANTLDDYREGTFTPTIVGATVAGTGTYITQIGRYTKIGRMVHVSLAVVWTAHTGTGNMRISGLPFTSVNATPIEWLCVPEFASMTMPANTTPCAAVLPNVSIIVLYSQAVGAGNVASLVMDTAASVYLSIEYEAA